VQAWAHGAVAAAGGAYDVSFAEIGALRPQVQPAGIPRMGASQAAVFVRKEGVHVPPCPLAAGDDEGGGAALVWHTPGWDAAAVWSVDGDA
jgi:hypothetical protein